MLRLGCKGSCSGAGGDGCGVDGGDGAFVVIDL